VSSSGGRIHFIGEPMTMIETRPDTTSTALSVAPGVVARPYSWLKSANHIATGKLFIVSGLTGTVGFAVLQAVVAFERAKPSSADLLTAEIGDQASTLATYGLMYLGILPLLMGLAVAIVPLQIGASTLAFPRAATFGFWSWLCGAGAMIGAYLDNGGPGGGDGAAVLLFLLAFGMVIVGLLTPAVCVATTVLTLRAPRLSLRRVPAFAWASLVHSIMLLLTLPVLGGNLIFLFVGQRYNKLPFGGNKAIAGELSWAVRQPMTVMLIVPLLGVALDVVPVMTRSRLRFPGVGRFAIGLAGFLSFGAFAQPARAPKVYTQTAYTLVSLMSPLPVVIVLGLCALTIVKGKARLSAALVSAMASLAMAGAGLSVGGLIVVDNVLDVLGFDRWNLIGSSAHDSQYAYLALAAGLGAMAALSYWGPKLWGQVMADKLVLPLAALGLLGTVLASLPLVVNQTVASQPASAIYGQWSSDADIFNIISGVGYALFAVAVLAFGGLLAKTIVASSNAVSAGPDPWGGHTLEWLTASPPAPGNFTEPLPRIRSDRPVLDAREALR
jgi:heme/copper-type cytochrome/quinol oxidase subunit 1